MTVNTAPDPMIVDAADIERVATRSLALTAVRDALHAEARGEVVAPGELALQVATGEVHIKGGHITGSQYIAFKTATSFLADGPSAAAINDGYTAVVDTRTGTLCALLVDHGLLTHLRTAAAAALAAEVLSRPESRRVALIGTGDQASYQLAALREVRDITTVRVWNRTPQRAREFVGDPRWAALDITVASTVRDAVAGADIVVTATASRTALVEAEWIAPGTHVTAMGADFTGKHELDPTLFARADRVVADDVQHCRQVGDLQHVDDEIASAAVSFAGVVAGQVTGRRRPEDITVIDQCGLGVYDAAIAGAVVDALRSFRR